MRTLIIFVFTQILIHALCYSQSFPELKKVTVNSLVEMDNSNFYIYSYALKNGNESNAAIIRLTIDISRRLETSTFDTTGLIFLKEHDQFSFNLKYPLVKDSIVPVGFPEVPEYWNGSITDSFEAWFSTQRNRNDIQPGETLYGFQLMSEGIPSIRSFKALPFINIDELYPSEFDVTNADSLFEQITEDRKNIEFHGITIAPKAPPKNLVPLDFLDTLLNYHAQSCELGWIENPGICRSLEAKLDNIKRQLEQGRDQTAANNLQAFLSEVEAIREQQLSPEAYALLKFNAGYLLEKLRD